MLKHSLKTLIKEKRSVRFVLVGIFNTLLDFFVLNILAFVFHVPSLIANSTSLLIAMSLSYFLNHYFVFRHADKPTWQKYFHFLALTGFSMLVIQNGTIYLLTHHINLVANISNGLADFVGLRALSDNFIRLNSAKAVATVLSLITNYYFYDRIVFRKKITDESSQPQ